MFDGQHNHLVKAAMEDRILHWLCKEENESNLLLFHHRFPTSTINVRRAAHPFTTQGYFGDTQYIMIHNGVVSNAEDLYLEHQEQGIEYQSLLHDLTFNDSEALAWDLALTLEGKQEELTAVGRIAFICLKLTEGKPDKLYFGRNTGSPLKLQRDKNGIMLASEGEGEDVDTNTLYTWNYTLKRMTKRQFTIPSYAITPYTGTCGYQPPGYQPQEWQSGQLWDDDDGFIESNWKRLRNKFDLFLQDGYVIEDEYTPTYHSEKEVKVRTNVYLIEAKGSFNTAYWYAEKDLDDAYEQYEITGDSYDIDLLEMVMERIENDPENNEENSISSIWKELAA